MESVKERLQKILGRTIRLIKHLPNISDHIHPAYSIQSDVNHESGLADVLHFTNLQPRPLNPAASPKYRDGALAMLYTFAQLLKALLKQTNEYAETVTVKIDRSAIALCRLCGSFPSYPYNRDIALLIMKRALFWAGWCWGSHNIPQVAPSIVYCSRE